MGGVGEGREEVTSCCSVVSWVNDDQYSAHFLIIVCTAHLHIYICNIKIFVHMLVRYW